MIPISHPDLATQVMSRVEFSERGAPPPSPKMNETQMGMEAVGGGLPFTKPQPEERARERAIEPANKAARAPLPGGMFVTQEISVGPGFGALPFDGRVATEDDFETTESLGDDPTTATNGRLPPPRAPRPSSVPPDDPTPRPYETRRASGKLIPPDIGPTPPPPLPHRGEASPLSRTLPGTPIGALARASKGAGSSSVTINLDESPTPAPVASMPGLALRPPPSTRLGALQLGTGKLASSNVAVGPAAATSPAAREAPTPTKAPAEPVSTASTSPSTPPEPRTNPEPPATPALSPPPHEAPVQDSTGEMVLSGDESTPSTEEPLGGANVLATDPKPALGPTFSKARETAFLEELTDSSTSDSKGVEARTLEEADADADRDAFDFPLPPSDGFEVDGVTLEHCAAIRAAIAMPKAERSAALLKHDLDEAAFARIEKTHLGRIDQETASGAQDLLNRYDAAYVAAQDKLRNPIGVKEYARIAVARREGDLADVMAELGVPRSELMRLDRVWKRRISEHPEVDSTLRSIMDSLGKKR